MLKQLLSLYFFLAFTTCLFAQTGVIRGNVFDKANGEPIIFGTVQLEGTTIGGSTDVNGFFTISGVPVGNYRLVATYIGYDSVAVDITLKANQILYQRLELSEGGIQLDAVQVSASREVARNEVQVSATKVTPKEIRAIPSAGGEADLAQYLPVIPGIIFTGDQGGQLYIRGGSPVQNRILLDGMTIYNPFHSIGFFSVFETETLRSVDVYTGGFSAEYGGRISAIVDIKTREGNKKRVSGLVSGSPFQAKALIEGPIIPLKEGGNGGSTSFLLTGKRSLIDQTSTTLYSYASEDSLGLPFEYTDIYGKLSFVSGNGSKLNVFGFNFDDRVNFSGVAGLDWNSTGIGADFNLIPPGTNMIIGGTVAYSSYESEIVEGDDAPRTSGIDGFNVGLNLTSFGKNSETKYGFEIVGFNTQFRFTNFLGFEVDQETFNTELGAYVKHRHKFGGLVIEPSLRMQFYASLSESSIEPRLGLKYNITDRLRIKAAGGFFSQNLISTVNEEDIVNLFVGFLSGPDETIFRPNSTERVDSRLQYSQHGIFGVEIDVTNKLQFNIEPYYKRFSQLINLNRNKIEPEDPNYVTETGDAYGIDFSAKYETANTYLWFTYSLGRVQRDDGEQVYPTIFDRRHNVNAVGTYSFGLDNQWEASLRWNLGSGFPFNLTQGFYQNFTFEDGPDTDINTGNGDLGILFSDERNSGRLPYYHRLDASIKRSIRVGEYSSLDITAAVTNIYDRENIFFFDRVDYTRVNQLPILPSVNVTFKF